MTQSRFVLLRHELPADSGRASHWDLLLERDEGCWTWALEELPAGLISAGGATTVPAKRLPDHRKHYLDYDGPLTNDRGSVTRSLAGTCEWLEESPTLLQVRLRSDEQVCDLLLEPLTAETWRISIP